MIKNILTTVSLLAALSMSAQQDETLFFNVNRIGIFGGPIFEFTELNEEILSSAGGGGGVILNDAFFGFYGSGQTNIDDFDYDNNTTDFSRINMKHRGLWMGYMPKQSKSIHPYLSGRIGWGRVAYQEAALDNSNDFVRFKDRVFVLTPEVGVEFNVFRFFRIALAANYRYVNGVQDTNPLSSDDLSNFGGVLTLRFGSFGNNFWWN